MPTTPLRSTLSQELLTPAKIVPYDIQIPTDMETTQTADEVQKKLKYAVEEGGSIIGTKFNPQQNTAFCWRNTYNSDEFTKIYI